MVFSYLVGRQLLNLGHTAVERTAYIVNTIPPLKMSLPKRGKAPDQKVRMPSSLKIRAAQLRLLLYSCLASIDCILVLIVSRGIVAYLRLHISLARRRNRFINVHCDDACHSPEAERAEASKLLSRFNIALRHLLQTCVAPETDGRIGGLPGSSRDETLEEASDALLSCNDRGAM